MYLFLSHRDAFISTGKKIIDKREGKKIDEIKDHKTYVKCLLTLVLTSDIVGSSLKTNATEREIWINIIYTKDTVMQEKFLPSVLRSPGISFDVRPHSPNLKM